MVAAGIEAMNVFGGSACVDVMELARHRELAPARVENLLMREKAVALPYEDAITYGVNWRQRRQAPAGHPVGGGKRLHRNAAYLFRVGH